MCVVGGSAYAMALRQPSVNFYWLIDELQRTGHWCCECGWWCLWPRCVCDSNRMGPFENGKNLNDQSLLAIHGEFDSMVWLSNRFIHPFIYTHHHIMRVENMVAHTGIRAYEAYLNITLPTVLKSLLFMVHKYCRKKTFGYSDDLVFGFFFRIL